MELNKFIGENTKQVEKAFGFTHYFETKDFLGEEQDHRTIVEAFFKFVKGDMIVVKTYDGIIKEFFKMGLDEIKKNLLLLADDKGLFYDNDLCISYGFLGDNFFAYLLPNILMFSAKEDNMECIVKILNGYGLKYFEPRKISICYEDS
ncbi:MAG: hypothetical protein KKA79_00060 [Nanoarchaeota archaeon]|nr:hypothetical protein [Nanoarchaeota archaeon]MCG2717909.1 hypothetical protein [Nanoarchaeota archaeon]